MHTSVTPSATEVYPPPYYLISAVTHVIIPNENSLNMGVAQ